MPLYLPNHTPTYKQGFARNAAESRNPGLWKGLTTAFLPILGPTGLTLRDVSGYDGHGSITGNLWETSSEGYALQFAADVTSDVVDYTTRLDYWTDDPFTIVTNARLLSSEDGGANRLFDTGVPPISFINMVRPSWTGLMRVSLTINFSSSVTLDSTTNPTDNLWHSLVFVKHGPALYQLYVDGQLEDEDTTNVPSDIPRGQTGTIGNSKGGDDGWEGLIGLYAEWNRALSLNEIKQLHQDQFALVRQRARVFPTAAAAPPAGVTMPQLINRRFLSGSSYAAAQVQV